MRRFRAHEALGDTNMFGFLTTLAIFIGVALLLRWIASRENPLFAVIVPENTTALVLRKPNTVKRDKDGKVIGVNNDGGGVSRVVHSASGWRIDMTDSDPQNWPIVEEEERRGLLFYLLDLQFIWFFRSLRANDIRTFRWGRKDDEDAYHMMSKGDITRFPHFTGQHDVEQKGIETSGVIKFDFRLNFTWRETYPVRARLRQADSFAQLTIMVNDHMVSQIGQVDPMMFIAGGGPDSEQNRTAKENLKRELIKSFFAGTDEEPSKPFIIKRIEDTTGITITTVNLPAFDFDSNTRTLLEKPMTAKIEKEALIIKGQGEQEYKILINIGDADRVTRVIIPAAQDERTVAVRQAEAYENNKTVTTLVVGSGATPVVPVGKP